MNQDQFLSAVRTVLKIAGSALATHGATKAASIVNSEDVIGLVLLIAAAAWSHFAHKSDPPTAPPMPSVGTTGSVLGVLLLLAVWSSGCAYVRSVTDKTTDGKGITSERTVVRAYTLFDSQSQLTKFRNTTGGPTSNAWVSGTSIGTLNESASSTNLNTLVGDVVGAAVGAAVKSAAPVPK